MTKSLYTAPRVDLVPLNQFSQRIAEGWTMVAGYPLQPGDFAITMKAPEPRGSNRSRARRRQAVHA